MIRLKQYYLRLIAMVVAVIISAPQTFAQVQKAPGGITGASLWSADGDSADFVANYRSLNLLDLKVQADTVIPPLQGATTLFLALKPNFVSATGNEFFELGDIKVYDNLLVHGSDSTALDFSDGNSKILTLSMQRSPRFKTSATPTFNLLDSNLFSVAELIYYPKLKSRQDIKMVNSYLALKYSVPITGVADPDWKDYWAADSSRYWDFTTDNQYSIRVLGLGSSQDEDFYQSQTSASSGSFIQLSLDSIKPIGTMPRVSMDEDAFLVLSERLPEQSSYYNVCLKDGGNPLGNWKLKPHGWSSGAQYLYVTMDVTLKSLSDSVWMTDGMRYTYVPEVSPASSSKVIYRIELDSIHNGMHYFFTDVKGDPCDEITIGTTTSDLTVDNQTGFGEVTLKYLNLGSGLTVEQPLKGKSFSTPIAQGQYQVWLLDKDGSVMAERIVQTHESMVAQTSSIEAPSLKLIPNPVLVGETSRLEICGLPTNSPVSVMLHDGSGKLEMKQVFPYTDQMSVELTGTSPGLHTVMVIQDGSIYSQKLLVAGH
jgi:hypothetical protein